MQKHDIKLVSINSVRANPRNARSHSKRQINQLSQSILKFGWTYPILTDEHGVLIAGAGRLLAAQELRLKKIPVIELRGLNDTEKRALALADNKIPSNAGWDRKKLAFELGELANLLPEINLELGDIGFEAAEFDNLLADFGDDSDPATSAIEVESSAVSRSGDLWRLGAHFILCGDSGCKADVAVLLGRRTAKMMFADAPYNLRISSIVGRGRRKHREFIAGSGEQTPDQFAEFLTKSFRLAAEFSDPGALFYCSMDWCHMSEMLQAGRSSDGRARGRT